MRSWWLQAVVPWGLTLVDQLTGAFWLHFTYKKIYCKRNANSLPFVLPSAPAPSMAAGFDGQWVDVEISSPSLSERVVSRGNAHPVACKPSTQEGPRQQSDSCHCCNYDTKGHLIYVAGDFYTSKSQLNFYALQDGLMIWWRDGLMWRSDHDTPTFDMTAMTARRWSDDVMWWRRCVWYNVHDLVSDDWRPTSNDLMNSEQTLL